MSYSRQAWRGPLWLRFDGTADSAPFTRLGRSGMAGNAWHGVVIRRTAGNARRDRRESAHSRQVWHGSHVEDRQAVRGIAGYV